MSSRNDSREKFLNLLIATGKTVITKQEIRDLCEANDMKVPQWFTKDDANRAGRGQFTVPYHPGSTTASTYVAPTVATESEPVTELHPLTLAQAPHKLRVTSVVTDLEDQGIVPTKYKNYVPFGNFDDLKAIIVSRQFYPVFITGPSGNGKSMSVEQVCAMLGREYVCVSMTPETDEGDLLGNYILLDNQMVWRDGAVTTAARRGAVLCIDEIDYGAQNLSC